MAGQLLANALTTLDRVKARLGITNVNHDEFLERLINAASVFLEGECNRTFKEATYTNEVHSTSGPNATFIHAKNVPVSALTQVQYRAGSPANPTWTSFQTDDYQLEGDGSSGLVEIAGGVPRGTNSVRLTYTAGYKVDFTAPTDPTKHTLPADLSDLCERIVARIFKKREWEGQQSSSSEGGTVTWSEYLDDLDQKIIGRYKRVSAFA